MGDAFDEVVTRAMPFQRDRQTLFAYIDRRTGKLAATYWRELHNLPAWIECRAIWSIRDKEPRPWKKGVTL